MRRHMQIVFQDPHSSLNPRRKIGEIVSRPLVIHGEASRRDADRRAGELLALVGLDSDMRGRFPHEFSGGQRQRIGIARALALRPSFIVLDEPTSSLDVSVQAQILNLLNDLKRELGLTYLFISHNLNVVEYFCDTTVVMYLGQVVESGPSEAIHAEPMHPYTQALMSAVLVPEVGRQRNRLVLSGRHSQSRQSPERVPVSYPLPVRDGDLPPGAAVADGASSGSSGGLPPLSRGRAGAGF